MDFSGDLGVADIDPVGRFCHIYQVYIAKLGAYILPIAFCQFGKRSIEMKSWSNYLGYRTSCSIAFWNEPSEKVHLSPMIQTNVAHLLYPHLLYLDSPWLWYAENSWKFLMCTQWIKQTSSKICQKYFIQNHLECSDAWNQGFGSLLPSFGGPLEAKFGPSWWWIPGDFFCGRNLGCFLLLRKLEVIHQYVSIYQWVTKWMAQLQLHLVIW